VQATSQVAALNLALSDGAPAATYRHQDPTSSLDDETRCNSRPATSETGHVAVAAAGTVAVIVSAKEAEIETIDREALRTRYSS